ncbi:MAG: ferredoxin family protein [Deltaproteobacteria bacterium]|jgi:adenylylsulfate reductase subunit B|nr:ferredoxin family protein [Deltaproteobacteria bacterium]
MSVRIDRGDCLGCGNCLDVCPGDLLSLDGDGKAVISEPGRCWGCCACMKECPRGCLKFYLSPASGGSGLVMTAGRVKKAGRDPGGGGVRWRISDGTNVLAEFLTRPEDDGY